MAYTGLIYTYWVGFYDTPTMDNDYSCHIKAIELFNQSYRVHIMPLVINSLGSRHTQAHMHTDFADKSNFKKPATYQPVSHARLV